jgi:hypothetical protein
MATYKLNVARVRGCPPVAEVTQALEEFGLPDTEEFGVLNHTAGGDAVFATIVRKTQQTVQRLDVEAREVTSAPVERATAYPFAVQPAQERLEIYAGSATGIEQVSLFLSGCLALPTVVDPIELDLLSAVQRLSTETQKFQLRAARVSEYAHNSFMSGPYAPKFLDTQHGVDFMEKYADYITSASVRFAGQSGKINVTLSPKACFNYSCHEDDQTIAQTMLRKLA